MSARKFVGKNTFSDELGAEIQSHPDKIGLDEYFQDGGSFGETSVEDLTLEINSRTGMITGSFSVSFTESYYNGCKDIDWSNNFSGTMDFELDPNSWELTITDEDIHKSRMDEVDSE